MKIAQSWQKIDSGIRSLSLSLSPLIFGSVLCYNGSSSSLLSSPLPSSLPATAAASKTVDPDKAGANSGGAEGGGGDRSEIRRS